MRWNGWTGAVTSADTLVAVLMDADKSLTANFGLNIVYVNKGNTAGPWNGRSWATAFRDIQSAVDTAKTDGGGEVWIQAGTYTGTTDPVVTMKPSVSVYGGFAGTEISRGARSLGAGAVTIDGENLRCCIIGAGYATLDTLTVTRGMTTTDGGGMRNISASPTVSNCIFTRNKADNGGSGGICHGGGMYNFASAPTISNCTFSYNTAGGSNGIGGGIFNAYSSPLIENCQFSSNTASSSGATPSRGGGICNTASSSPYLSNCFFSSNAAYCGAGLANTTSSPMLTNCSFSSNAATDGGGIFNDASAPVLERCSFSANTASTSTSGVVAHGGAMCNTTASAPILLNVVFTNNTANCGGAMANLSASPVVTNCTFTLNKATTGATPNGGGMYNSGAAASPKVTNCILWGDTATTGPEIYDSSSTPVVTYSCVQGGYTGTGNLSANPLFISAPADLRLQDGSPCIDTGTESGAPSTDIRAVPRPQGLTVDMGINEMIPLTSPPVILGCPGNYFVSQDLACQAVVPNFAASVYAVDDHDFGLEVTQSPLAGSAATPGYIPVTLTVTNDVGLFSTCLTALVVADTYPPVITLLGANSVTMECHGTYSDAGATATDNCSGSLTANISVSNPLDVNRPGAYTVRYNVSDSSGNGAAEVTRTVTVVDTTKPVITLSGSPATTVECRSAYLDAGATAADLCAGDLTTSITYINPVDTNVPGTYTVRMNVADGNGNSAAEITRTVTVVDTTKPVITMNDTTPITVECHGTYTDAGATANDSCVGNLTAGIVTVNPVNVNAPGSYTVRYNVSDGNGNSADEATRTVNVVDTTKPFIALGGDTSILAECNTFFQDPGAVAGDTCAGNLTASIVVTNPIKIGVLGTYTVTYDVSDGNGNSAQVKRFVTVADTTRPVITRNGNASVTVECRGTYSDAGATAADICAGNVTASIVVSNPVDTNVPGTYTVHYNANDGNGAGNNAIEVTRTVNVVDTAKPVITLLGDNPATIECHGSYADAGATASDTCAGDLTASIVAADNVDVNAPGTYTVRYNVSDGNGNGADEVTRTVTVADTVNPVITLLGDAASIVECGASYTDAGATASDTCAGDISAAFITVGQVNAGVPGVYTVAYNAADASGNAAAEVTRTVTVTDTVKPVITLLGAASETLDCGGTYADAGVTASDACTGDLTAGVATTGLPPVGPLGPGNWTVTYNVVDGNGHAAVAVSRTVTVRDNCTLAVNAVGDTLIHTNPGAHLEIAVAVTGAVGTASYQWGRKPGGGSAFANLPGETEAALVFDPVDNDALGQFICAVSDAVTTVNSPVFTVTLTETMPLAGLIGLAATASALGLGGAFTVRRKKR